MSVQTTPARLSTQPPSHLPRVSLTLLVVSLLAMWLLQPAGGYFRRITTLAVDTYRQAGLVVVSNALVQTEAAARGLSLSLYTLYEIGLSTLLIIPFWFVAALILWRAENRWFGWFTAMILAALT